MAAHRHPGGSLVSVDLPTMAEHRDLVARVERQADQLDELAGLVRAIATPPLMMKMPEAAAYSGLPADTLRALIDADRLRWHFIEGSRRLSRSDLDDLAARSTGLTATELAEALKERRALRLVDTG